MYRVPNFYRNQNDLFIPNNAAVFPIVYKQKETTRTRFSSILSEFCRNSSIHGVRYFTDQRRHWVERVWWIVAFVLSVYLCFSSIYSVFSKWIENPVILSFDNKPMSIGEIPFPAVTICPLTKTSAEKFNYTDVYRSMFKLDGNESRTVSKDELELIQIISQVCDERISFDVLDLFTENYSDSSIVTPITELAPKFEDTFVSCRLFDRYNSCDKLLFPSVSEEGLCYVFNQWNPKDILSDETHTHFARTSYKQPPSNWDPEDGYDEPRKGEKYPYRVFGTGKRYSLTILLRVFNHDIDHLCSGAVQGFKVIFHAPNEGPQVLKRYFQVSPGRTALFIINPRLTITSKNIRNYSPDVKQCYFLSERHLQFYRIYTQRNCEVECLANFTLAHCGCVRIAMPRKESTKICGPAKTDCAVKADNDLFQEAFYKCNCLPTCTSIKYDADVSQADFNLVTSYSMSRFPPSFSLENSTFSRLVVSFKEESLIPSKRAEFHNLNDFLAHSGGLFSLCMGASLLSFIELIYYFTLRVIFTKRTEQQINQQNDMYNSLNPATKQVPNKKIVYLP